MSITAILIVAFIAVALGLLSKNNDLTNQNKQLQQENHLLFMANNRLSWYLTKAQTELRHIQIESNIPHTSSRKDSLNETSKIQ